jgi:hypothetical protein
MDVCVIKLTRGLITVVSSEYGYLAIKYKWHTVKSSSGFYAATWIKQNGLRKKLYLHRLILGCKGKEQGHHRDSHTLNNLTSNLEKCPQHKNLSYRKY